jgi:hypothetical protein
MSTRSQRPGAGRSRRYAHRVSEPGDAPAEAPLEESPGDVTVGAFLDVDPPPPEQSLVREPSERPPSLWARIMRALRGRS